MNRPVTPILKRPLLHVEDRSISYQVRPGAYAIILNEQDQLLLLKEPTGWFLPGGGQDAGESLEQTLIREVREELGLKATPTAYLLAADDCRYSPVYKQHFHIQSHYFMTNIDSADQIQTEAHTELTWVPIDDAKALVTRFSDQWLSELLTSDFRVVSHPQDMSEQKKMNPGAIYWQQSVTSNWHEAEFVLTQDDVLVGWIRLAMGSAGYEVRGVYLQHISFARTMLQRLEYFFKGIEIVDPGGLFSQ